MTKPSNIDSWFSTIPDPNWREIWESRVSLTRRDTIQAIEKWVEKNNSNFNHEIKIDVHPKDGYVAYYEKDDTSKALAGFTPGPWRFGNHMTTVVSDTKIVYTHPLVCGNQDSDVEYYGGYMIAESILNEANGRLISASPDMYSLLSQLVNIHSEDELGCIISEATQILNKIDGKPEVLYFDFYGSSKSSK